MFYNNFSKSFDQKPTLNFYPELLASLSIDKTHLFSTVTKTNMVPTISYMTSRTKDIKFKIKLGFFFHVNGYF